ncbi:hypothetical protein LINGRAHAP2_LOCUS22672, partial [Linum grandiflorum]
TININKPNRSLQATNIFLTPERTRRRQNKIPIFSAAMAAAGEPDKDLSRWALDFLLRQPIPVILLGRVAFNLKPAGVDCRLKKQFNLKLIQSEISKGSVSEDILESLEVIEQLDRDSGGIPISQTMKAAYCAVALECTVKGGIQLEFVERIWRGRVQNLESLGRSELVTDELRKFKGDIEATLSDVNACMRLFKWTKQNDAKGLVRAYLDEAMAANNEPSFLDLAAARWKKMEVEKKRKTTEGGHEEMGECSKDLGAEDGMDTGVVPVPDHVEQPISDSPDANLRQKNKGYNRVKHVAPRKRLKRQARVLDVGSSKYDTLPSPEVKKVQDALRSCSIELQAVVTDPLPDAMYVTESLIAEAPRNISNKEKSVGNQNEDIAEASMPESRSGTLDPDIPAEERNREEVDEPEPSAQQDYESMQTYEGNKAAGLSRHQNVSKPSLMTRNGTACTYEWDDSISSSSQGSSDGIRRIRIKTPKRDVVLPLVTGEGINVPRRKKRRWSVEEEDALRAGVDEYDSLNEMLFLSLLVIVFNTLVSIFGSHCYRLGRGRWKAILDSRREVFIERTEVDLKDKWRNMTAHV